MTVRSTVTVRSIHFIFPLKRYLDLSRSSIVRMDCIALNSLLVEKEAFPMVVIALMMGAPPTRSLADWMD